MSIISSSSSLFGIALINEYDGTPELIYILKTQ